MIIELVRIRGAKRITRDSVWQREYSEQNLKEALELKVAFEMDRTPPKGRVYEIVIRDKGIGQ